MKPIFPMGAKKVDRPGLHDQLLNDDSYIAQEKIDGIRAMFTFTEDGSLKVTTRGATLTDPGTPIDITHRCIPLLTKIPALAGTTIDGELIFPGATSAETAGILNYRSSVVIPYDLTYKMFDITSFKGKELTQMQLQRRLQYSLVLEKLHDLLPFYHALPTYTGVEDKTRLLNEVLDRGDEGIVLKNLHSLYYPDKKRANVWYKLKISDNTDATIIGSEPPEQFYRDQATGIYDFSRITKPWGNGWIGAIKYRLEDGHEGTVSGLSDSMKIKISDGQHRIKPEYIGRVIEIEFMQKTSDGNLRHPRFKQFRDEIEKK